MYKIEIKGNYFYLINTVTGTEEVEHSKYVIGEQINGTDRIEIKLTGTAYNDKRLSPNGGILFSDIDDSTDTPFASMAALKTWFENNTGKSKATGGSVAGIALTQEEYDALSTEAKEDGSKLYLISG